MLRFSSLTLILVGCGGSVVDGVPTDGGVDTAVVDTGRPELDTGVPSPPVDAAPPMPGATPPKRPAATASGGATKWFAVRKLHLGLTHRATGVADPSAWKQYGYDLDSRTTTREDSKASTNSCKRRDGSSTNVLADGELGRDNNFGQHFMSIVKSLKADAEEAVNGALTDGSTTLLLRLDNVGPADNATVPGAVFVAGPLGGTPRWDGTDKWPIDSSSVDSARAPLFKFANGYMAGGVWVSGDPGSGSALVPLPLFGAPPLLVPLDGALLSFDVATGAMGTIAGASNTTKFIDTMTPLMKRFGICPGNATFDQVASTITSSADLVTGAPLLQDTTKVCDAMSVGIGFAASPVRPSDSYSTPPAPGPDECGM